MNHICTDNIKIDTKIYTCYKNNKFHTKRAENKRRISNINKKLLRVYNITRHFHVC